MQPIVKYTLRVCWQKKGNAKYISHLDTQRTVTRALVRSGLPLYYSQGYNPHLKLVFALPVSMYQEALYDLFDIDLLERVDPAAAAEAINSALPEDMTVISAAYPVKKFKELAFASYDMRLDTALSAAEVTEMLAGEVRVEKKSKKKCEVVDISPMIKSLTAEDTEGGVILRPVLSAAPDAYLNPKYLVDFLGDKVKGCDTVRTMLFDGDMEPLK